MRPLFLFLALGAGACAQLLDLATFARPCCSEDEYRLQTTFDYARARGVARARDGHWIYGLQWAEERDVEQIRARFREGSDTQAAGAARVEYWFQNWPYDPPRMPTIEDPVDDPWQGRWLTAASEVRCEGRDCRWTFRPLEERENPRARNLPGVRYRRAIKIRLLFPAGARPEFEPLQVFSETTVKPVTIRLLFGVDGAGAPTGQPRFTAYNGRIREVQAIAGGVLLDIDASDPHPPGSNDVTVVEVHNGEQSFAFTPSDAESGPMYLPDFHAYITLASDQTAFSPAIVKRGARIRERLAVEPEQTYERASREIPALDPVERQGGRLYLPLAADASWQKFALEWGGNVTISKNGTKAMGRERRRLTWPGDRISWRIGTGERPAFRPKSADSTLSVLEDWLPVAIARWKSGAIEYEEEAFATLLSGPLSPEDAARSEQTPAVLLMRLSARNRSDAPQTAHVWLGMDRAEPLAYADGLLTAGGGEAVRAALHLAKGATAQIASCDDSGRQMPALHILERLAPGAESASYLALPFIPGLTAAERARLKSLDFAAERKRVVDYWRGAVGRGMPFQVPEERFNTFARGLIARIRISATKDPGSGIYMVPAASYYYNVFANEAVFQSQLLDVAGHGGLAARYLQAQVDLQGSRPFLGTYTGDQKAVYHGARVSAEYDYTSSEYNLDHGAVLWSLAEHYLLTRDRAWLARVAPGMKRAAGWVAEQRKLTQVLVEGEPCPEYGLLPAGHLEDNADWGHWFSVNAYASAGMSELAEALKDAGDPEAPRYAREAEAYRKDLRAAVMRAAAASPVIRLRDNTWVPYVPTRAHQRIRLLGPLRVAYYSRYPQKALPTYRLSATRELLYGPLILFDTGILDANTAVARWVLDDWEDNATMSEPLGLHVHGWVDEQYWFSRGGMVFQANLQNPIRTYIRRGEARAAVRNLYNDFVACYYPAVNVFTEEFRQWRSPSGPFYKVSDEAKFVHRLRDLLVTEYDGELLLAAGTPGCWLAAGQKFSVTEAPTRFGPASYSLEARAEEVRGQVSLPARNPFRNAWLYVHLPEGRIIASVAIDGKTWTDLDLARSRIRLPRSRHPLAVLIRTTAR
jgi:hypothetical protein